MLSTEQLAILQCQLEHKGVKLETMSKKKKNALLQKVKECRMTELVPVFAENAEWLAKLAGIPADQMRVELETDPFAPFRRVPIAQLLALQGS